MEKLIIEFISMFCFTTENLGYWLKQYVLRTRNGNQGIIGQYRMEPGALSQTYY